MKKKDNVKDNVIDFPNSKPKKALPKKKRSLDFSSEQKKVIISAFLVSILLVVTLLNRSLVLDITSMHREVSPVERNIASPEGEKDKRFDEQLAERLSQTTRRAFASIGRKPTAQESFIYGDFSKYRGHYVVIFDDIGQHLVSLSYISDHSLRAPSQPSQTKMLSSTPEKFFKSYKSIFQRGVINIVPKGKFIKVNGDLRERTYRLVDIKGQTVAKVKFTMAGPKGEFLYKFQTIE